MEKEIEALRQRIDQLEAENKILRFENNQSHQNTIKKDPSNLNHDLPPLSLEEFKRYGRQMIVPGFGSLGSQVKLKRSRVLVIGAGGLGCPALLYLCGAGIGIIGILDNDIVDASNLHRQVLHTTDSIGKLKCESAKRYLRRLNPNIDIKTHAVRLSNGNAFDIISQYDVVVDCTDTPATRYLINDVAVISGKPVVSGSGVKTDGQITILNFDNKGPCYRCFHPKPPSPDSVPTCSDAGVLGPAIGLTGTAVATETIKVLIDFYKESFRPFIAMYSAFPQQTMRVFKMRNRQPNCVICGDSPKISKADIESGIIDYTTFCGVVPYEVLPNENRVTVQELSSVTNKGSFVLLDVRPKDQYEIVSLPGSINIEWERGLSRMSSIDKELPESFDKNSDEIIVICRYGNDSQLAARKLIDELGFKNVRDVKGGINRWSAEVDPSVPLY